MKFSDWTSDIIPEHTFILTSCSIIKEQTKIKIKTMGPVC